MVTSVDVAEFAGVSQSTVSRVLNDDPAVRPATREKVLAAAAELGYVVNVSARSLVTRRTRTVGLVVADTANLFYPQIIHLMNRELAARNYQMVMIRESLEASGSLAGAALQELPVDGAIFASATAGSLTVKRFKERNLPIVLFNRDDPSVNAEVLLPDDQSGCQQVADHLVGLGHKRIGLITGSWATTSGRQREEFFRSALEGHGLSLPGEMVERGFLDHDTGSALTRKLLAVPNPPTAIFCGSDMLAIGALDAAAELGVEVPGKLSVVGFDDLEPASWRMINLSTVHQPLDDMAREAVAMLVDHLEGRREQRPGRKVFPVELILRGTSAPPASPQNRQPPNA